jgi:hypothetical protein
LVGGHYALPEGAAGADLLGHVLETTRIGPAREVGTRGRDHPDAVDDGARRAFERGDADADRVRPRSRQPAERRAGFGSTSVSSPGSSARASGPADGRRGLRYLEWVQEASPEGLYDVDFAYMLREDGQVRVEYDRHECCLFPRETWLRGLKSAGFEVRVVEPDCDDSTGQLIFAARRVA